MDIESDKIRAQARRKSESGETRAPRSGEPHHPGLIEGAKAPGADPAHRAGDSYSDFTLDLLRHEYSTRQSRRLTRNLKRSGLPVVVEGLDGFDFSVRQACQERFSVAS